MAPQLPPGLRGPRAFNTIRWQKDPAGVIEKARERYGDIWTLKVSGGTTFVIVTDTDLIDEAFRADKDVLHGGEAKKQVAQPMLGDHSLLLIDGEEHTDLRGLMLPAFHRERVQGYQDLIVRLVEEEVASWPVGETFRLHERMQRITLNGILNAIFGAPEGEAQDRLRARIADMHKFTGKPWQMLLLFIGTTRGKDPPKRFTNVRAPLDDVIYDEIRRAREDPNIDKRDDVLALLVQARHEDGSELSDQELRDQMMTLFVQGHTSTAAALSWALERMIRKPEMLERIRAEAEAGGDDHYLEAVMKETLRLRPTIPITTRLVKKPYRLGEWELPVGVTLTPCIYGVHHRPDLYPDPEEFRPERFLDGEPPSGHWIPFGGGERYCIGRTFATHEIKTVLRTIAERTRLEPGDGGPEGIVRQATTIAPNRGATALLRERIPAAKASKAG